MQDSSEQRTGIHLEETTENLRRINDARRFSMQNLMFHRDLQGLQLGHICFGEIEVCCLGIAYIWPQS